MASHIGIVACSAEGAALCYRTICTEGPALMGDHNHPEVSMHTFPFQLHVDAMRRDDWPAVAELMLSSALKLAQIGADFAICPDNTAHQALPMIRPRSPIPWLHIAEEVTKEAARLGYRKIGLTGTRSLVMSDVYPDAFADRDIQAVRPAADQQCELDAIIFDELVYGNFLPKSLSYLLDVMASLKDAGCDAVVLGCTELPILVADQLTPLPTLDSTRILARAALAKAAAAPQIQSA
jgi:aspartate racemase